MTEKIDTKAPKITKAKLIEMAKRRVEVMAEIKELEAEKAKIDAKLLALDLTKDYTGDGVRLSFTPVRGLDNAAIVKKFPAAKRPEFYKLALDITAFRQHFSPVELESFEKITHRIKVEEL